MENIMNLVDHTLLKQDATWADIRKTCDEGMEYHTASVCIPPSFVKTAAEYMQGKLPVCTVIGFPNGYNTTSCKVFETTQAIKDGADEIDMVANIGWIKDGNYDAVLEEINAAKAACSGKILKVIIETCLLTQDEKIQMCEVITRSTADYIKTSTGFAGDGATFEDIRLFKTHVGSRVKIKAAGGINTLEDANEFVRLGANRLGTSRMIKLVQQESATGY